MPLQSHKIEPIMYIHLGRYYRLMATQTIDMQLYTTYKCFRAQLDLDIQGKLKT